MTPGGRGTPATAFFASLAFVAMFMFGGLVAVTMLIDEASIPIWLATLVAGAIVLRGPLGKAMARSIDSGAETDQVMAARVLELEDRVAELNLEVQRMAEIEERLDFTERLLSSARRDEEPGS